MERPDEDRIELDGFFPRPSRVFPTEWQHVYPPPSNDYSTRATMVTADGHLIDEISVHSDVSRSNWEVTEAILTEHMLAQDEYVDAVVGLVLTAKMKVYDCSARLGVLLEIQDSKETRKFYTAWSPFEDHGFAADSAHLEAVYDGAKFQPKVDVDGWKVGEIQNASRLKNHSDGSTYLEWQVAEAPINLVKMKFSQSSRIRVGYYVAFLGQPENLKGKTRATVDVWDFEVKVRCHQFLRLRSLLATRAFFWTFQPNTNTQISYRDKDCVFLGTTLRGNLILQPKGQTAWELARVVDCCCTGDTVPLFTACKKRDFGIVSAHKRLLQFMQKNTIRGVNLYDLLKRVCFRDGYEFKVYVVGGAVRDCISSYNVDGQQIATKNPNDIDLVFAAPFDLLVTRIRDVFAALGVGLTDTTFRVDKAKAFGQCKIIRLEGEVLQDLDIALFKSRRVVRDAGGDAKECDSELLVRGDQKLDDDELEYVFGYSPQLDAKQRDFTLNALYMPVFDNSYVLDPLRTGLADLRANRLRFANREAFLKYDLGGQLRIYKLLAKKNEMDREDLTLISDVLVKHLNDIESELDAIVNTEAQEKALKFLRKLNSKLFSNLSTLDGDAKSYAEAAIEHKLGSWKRILKFCREPHVEQVANGEVRRAIELHSMLAVLAKQPLNELPEPKRVARPLPAVALSGQKRGLNSL